jgi:uncharacterized protein (TIGR03086 family)
MSDRVAMMVAMTEETFARFDRAAAVGEQVIAGVKADQLDDPTPCTEWSVRQLINHLVTGTLAFVSIVTGAPAPDRGADHLGDAPLDAYRGAVRELRAALSAEGAMDRTYPTPLGQGPGAMLLTMRTIETTVHSWDLAKATGQSTDLDAELARWALGSLRGALPADRAGGPFAAEQPAPPAATAADQLAAFAGRTVR